MRILPIVLTLALVPSVVFAGNWSKSVQKGNHNRQQTTQSDNAVSLTAQIGNSNNAKTHQMGKHNISAIVQKGDGFMRTVNQNADNQAFGSLQFDTKGITENTTTTGGNSRAAVTLHFEAR